MTQIHQHFQTLFNQSVTISKQAATGQQSHTVVICESAAVNVFSLEWGMRTL